MKVEDSTLAVVRAFERMGVAHYLGGSMASSLHGEPRATNDADLVAVLVPSDRERLQRELGTRFYVDPEEFETAVRTEPAFNLIDEVELAKVDVFCVRAEGYQAEALRRAVKLELEADDPFSQVSVASAEDIIILKLRWYRLGGLDLGYIQRWCAHFSLTDVLDRLIASAS